LYGDASDTVAVGDVIDGRFRVEKVLGEGGMGVVVQATHLQLHQPVAVKLLHAEAARDERKRARFLREAQVSARLRSEHVVRLMDFGLSEHGAPIIVMEYLEGTDLAAVLAKGPLPVDTTVEYLLQAVEGIAEAHAHGLVHRDLKPANLFVSRATDGTPLVKVLDFGVSKLAVGFMEDGLDGSLTIDKAVVGSPAYMAPEQIIGEPVDARADVWSMGVILFECLTGRTPFRSGNIPKLFSMIVDHPAPKLADRRPDAPGALQALVDSCLTKSREERCPTVAVFASELVKAAPTPERLVRVAQIQRLIGAMTTTVAADSAFSPEVVVSSSRWTRAAKPSRAWAREAVLLAAALAVLSGVLIGIRPWSAGARPVDSMNSTASAVRSGTSAQPEPLANTPASAPSTVATEPAAAPVAATSQQGTTKPPDKRALQPRRKPSHRQPDASKTDLLDSWEPLEEEP